MKRIFLDTNIILDFLIREEYKSTIKDLILLCSDKELCISFLTVANAAYVMRKYPRNEIYKNIGLIIDLFRIIENDKEIIEKSLMIESPDFEDMLQYQTALRSNCEVIVTRNKKDFPYSKIPIMSVDEILASL